MLLEGLGGGSGAFWHGAGAVRNRLGLFKLFPAPWLCAHTSARRQLFIPLQHCFFFFSARLSISLLKQKGDLDWPTLQGSRPEVHGAASACRAACLGSRRCLTYSALHQRWRHLKELLFSLQAAASIACYCRSWATLLAAVIPLAGMR